MKDPGHTTAFCLGFRNWHLAHLVRCLRSIRAQTPSPIVVCDLGSDDAVMPRLRAAVAAVDGRLVTEIQPEWSRSRALNQAAAGAPPDVLRYVFTDADMLFPRAWFLAADRVDPLQFFLTRARDLSESATEALDGPVTDEWLATQSAVHPQVGQGAAMVVPAEWFWKVGGFDEFYQVWGAEDQDLVDRATWDGLPVQWLPEAWVVHQWHRRDWPTPAQFDVVNRNRVYYRARGVARGPIVRNKEA